MKFNLSEKEDKTIKDWIKIQIDKETKNTTIGGRFTYSFTPNGIGTGIIVIDNLTGDKINATDYDCW